MVIVKSQVEDLINLLTLHDGKDFRMETVFCQTLSNYTQSHKRHIQVFGIPVINVLWTIVAGQRFNFSDPKAQRLMELLNRYMFPTIFIIMSIENIIPIARKFTSSTQ